MAGRHGFEQTGDRHRAPTFSFPRNADPRNSPPLQIRGSTITAFAEPRNLSQSATLNHDDFEDEEDDASENYTHTSKTYSTNDGDIEQRLRVISLEDGPSRGLGIDPGKNDKEIARSYAEAVKCSPRTSHTQPTQEAPSSDHSKHPVRDSATLQRRGPAYKKSAQSLQEIVGKAVRLRSNVRQDTATNRTEVGIRNEGIEGTNRSVARGGPLEEKNKYHTIRHGYPANRNHTYPTPIAHDYQHSDKSAAHHAVRRSNSVPGEESTSSLLGNVLPNSWLLNTKGIGHWADEPSRWYDRPSLKPDIPRIVSTTSPEYRKLITLEAVAQCASGNSNSAGSKKPSAQSSKSRVGRQPGSGKGGKRPAGNGRDRKDNAGEDEGDGNDGNRKKDSQSPRGDSRQPNGPKKWYACHFHKHDPLYFSINDFTGKQYKTCAGKWTDISRLKEHLYRVHTDPPTCDRCQKKFADEGELTAHLPEQGALRCPLTDRTSKGIHRKVGEQLRKRPQRNMTSEDRWWAIWALLFPKEERPNSPYSDLDGPADPAESDTFHLFLEQRMARQLEETLDRYCC
ncbi:uncharacterized protein LY89DRAFT_148693 [Mollisia scopiformis]|uniref:C2H2-type domain-containing protein n=1 Tax=Mollisia scopiformis TaxID=149040 RepID=A0A194X0W5_MOLSC|nr:uncharacterized protein LY89DRAFT_148693 [Mollisia scopiformis]KUJ13841.1 hypothetical protein LY89DRAFT_148693 [Mollisia scopiformis]